MMPSFDDYFRPLALIGNIFGVIHFSPKTNRGNFIFLYVRCVPFTILFVSISLIALKLPYEEDYSPSNGVKKFGDIFLLCICVFWTYIKFIYYVLNRQNYQQLIKDLTKLGARCDLPNKRSNNWIKIGIWIGSLLTYFVIDFIISKFEFGIWFTLTYGFGIYIGIYESIFMSSIIKELEDIFQYINNKLEQPPEFLNIPQKRKVVKQKLSTDHEKRLNTLKTNDKKIFLENIYNLIELHFETTNLCQRMNEIFTYPLLGLLLMGFTFIVNCGQAFLFSIFATYHITGFIFPVYMTVMHAFWSILELSHLFFTIRPWAQLTEESVKTSTHIHEIWNILAIDNEIDINSSHLQLIAVQLLNRKLKFTANGLFPINMGLFQMIIAAVSTYIVILIQFEMSAMKKYLKKVSTIS